MRKSFFSLAFAMLTTLAFAQTPMKTYTVGHPFTISLPAYMSRTAGLNSSAAIEYKNTDKDVFGFVIIDDKELMKSMDVSFGTAKEFYDDFIKDFIEGEEKVKQSTPITKTVGAIKFVEADVSFYDKDAETEIFYLVGIVETSKAFYKVMSYCTLANKDKFKEDFKKILYSIKD